MTGQQITTAAELDALPEGSVIRLLANEGGGNVAIKDQGELWSLAGVREPWTSKRLATAMALPAVVLTAAGDGATDEREALAEVIWDASRADEGTISAIGAKHVAGAILAAGFRRQGAPTITAEQVEGLLERFYDEEDGSFYEDGWRFVRDIRAALGVQP